MIKTRMGRAIASGLVYTIALDIALAYIIALLLDPRDFWLAFAVILGVFWLAPLVFDLKTLLYKVLFFFLNRASIRRGLVQEFRREDLPLLSEEGYNDPADTYFSEVARDETLPKSARLYAAQTIGQLSIMPRYSSIDSMVAYANLDAALAIYFDEMRRDGVEPHSL